MRNPLVFALLAAAALSVSCATKVQRAQAVQPAIQRQIQNAAISGEGDARVRQLRAQMVANPDDVAVRLELARHFRLNGMPELAAEHCILGAERFPLSAELQLLLAQSRRDLRLTDEAAEGLEWFLSMHPQKDAEYASWLGILWDEAGKPARAEQFHRTAIGLAPPRDFLHNNLGYNLLLQGRRQEAAAEFRKALKLKPYSEFARNNLAAAVADQPSEALTLMQSMTDPATAHSNVAALLLEQGRYAEARRELELALGYNKLHPAALHNMELVSRLDGKPARIPAKPAKSRWGWLRSTVRVIVGG